MGICMPVSIRIELTPHPGISLLQFLTICTGLIQTQQSQRSSHLPFRPSRPSLKVNGTDYVFNVGTQQLLTLNVANGDTSFVANVSPGGMYVGGATPTPEPFS